MQTLLAVAYKAVFITLRPPNVTSYPHNHIQFKTRSRIR